MDLSRVFLPFTINYGGGQPLRRTLVLVLFGAAKDGALPQPRPCLPLRAAKDGAQLQLVDPGAPSTSIPCTGLVELGVRGLPPLPPWLPQLRNARDSAALPLSQPRLGMPLLK